MNLKYLGLLVGSLASVLCDDVPNPPAAATAGDKPVVPATALFYAFPITGVDNNPITTSTTTTTSTEPTTTTTDSSDGAQYSALDIVYKDNDSGEKGEETGVSPWKERGIRGSEELKVLFRDCSPYSKDCLFGGPVCGSDKRTYPNIMYLKCINSRRHPKDRVRAIQEGPCWFNPGHGHCPLDPVYNPVCGTDDQTYANKLSLQCTCKKEGKDIQVKYQGECIGKGHCFFKSYDWDRPVCSTSGRTMQSHQAMRCLRSLGSTEEITHDGHCTSRDLKCALNHRRAICKRSLTEVEPFPVCASDGQTYPSAGYVICHRPHLEIDFDFSCNSTERRACLEAERCDKERMCKVVCGSDGKNYNSHHHLYCAKIVKNYLTLIHEGKCEAMDSPCARLHSENKKNNPVCASDGVTYTTPLTMECVSKYKKSGVEFRHMGPCMRKY